MKASGGVRRWRGYSQEWRTERGHPRGERQYVSSVYGECGDDDWGRSVYGWVGRCAGEDGREEKSHEEITA